MSNLVNTPLIPATRPRGYKSRDLAAFGPQKYYTKLYIIQFGTSFYHF
jgi:hypothetical protein